MTEQLKSAIADLTNHARRFADIGAQADKEAESITQQEKQARIQHVHEVCDEIDALARQPSATFLDFEHILNKSDSFPAPPLDFVDAVANAFLKAGRLS